MVPLSEEIRRSEFSIDGRELSRTAMPPLGKCSGTESFESLERRPEPALKRENSDKVATRGAHHGWDGPGRLPLVNGAQVKKERI